MAQNCFSTSNSLGFSPGGRDKLTFTVLTAIKKESSKIHGKGKQN